MVVKDPLEVGELDPVRLVEIHQSIKSIQLSGQDLFLLDFKDASETPSKIILHNESIEISIKAFECLFNGDPLVLDPSLDLLDY